MKFIESKLLRLIRDEDERVQKLTPIRDWNRAPRERIERNREIDFYADGQWVRIDSNWIGTDGASRQSRRRGLEALQEAGLIELAYAGTKTKYARLTDRGRSAEFAGGGGLPSPCHESDREPH